MPTVNIFEDPMSNTTTPALTSNMYRHPFVEDYIEIIAGYRKPDGKNNHSIFVIGEPIISLARYDMKIIPSLAEQTIGQNKSYTDKQAQLATQLVLKYERQLAKLGIDVDPVRTPQYRLPIRTLDRSTRVWIEDNTIKLKFPYDVKLIEQVREVARESKGRFKFVRETKLHEADLTEWNLNWIYTFSKSNNFEIDHTVEDLMKAMLAVEQAPYAIELVYNRDQLHITNAPDSLVEYIDNHLGGFALENILTLCDYAPILGYTVHTDISNDVIKNFSTRFWSLCANRQLRVDPLTSHNLVQDIATYARATNRFPIYVYEADLSGRLKTEFNRFFPGSIMTLDNKVMDVDITEDVKVVYTSRIPKVPVDRIPIMVSSAGMLYGGDRQIWLQQAEKVVFFTKDVYNKNNKGKEVCKLD